MIIIDVIDGIAASLGRLGPAGISKTRESWFARASNQSPRRRITALSGGLFDP
jgi:hypothetical protein